MIADLWWLLFWLGLAVFVLFAAVLVVAMIRGRGAGDATPPAAGDDAAQPAATYLRRWVVGLGVIMTTAVLIVVLAATIVAMRAIPHTAASDALVVELVAEQFAWTAHYPAHDVRTKGEVPIPVGRQVELRITSTDVIHSFWVPELAGKIDALPERVNTLVLAADRPGRYRGQCAEFCGLYHARMEVVVVAMRPDEFTEWLERET